MADTEQPEGVEVLLVEPSEHASPRISAAQIALIVAGFAAIVGIVSAIIGAALPWLIDSALYQLTCWFAGCPPEQVRP